MTSIQPEKAGSVIRIVCLSDTHNLHRDYGRPPFGDLPPGEMLIHAGDVTTHGTLEELANFLLWFERQPHPIKIFIAGNHDRCLETERGRQVARSVPSVRYLEDESCMVNGLNVYGSPYTPRHQNFAFQLNTQEEGRANWAKIPEQVDVLVTHGPPAGILDHGAHAGCPELLARCGQVRPRLHVFGHDHAAYGQRQVGDTLFVNASVHTWLWKLQPFRMDAQVIRMEHVTCPRY